MATSMDTGQDALGGDNMEIFEEPNIEDEIMIYDSDDNIDDEMGDKSPNVSYGHVELQQDEELNDAVDVEDPDLELAEAPDERSNQVNDQDDDFEIDIGGPSDSIDVPSQVSDHATAPTTGDASIPSTQDVLTSKNRSSEPYSTTNTSNSVPDGGNQLTANTAEKHISSHDDFRGDDGAEDYENEGNGEVEEEPGYDDIDHFDAGAGEEPEGNDPDAEGSYNPETDPAPQQENIDPASQLSSDSHSNQRRTSNHYDSPEYKNEYADFPITLYYQEHEMSLFHHREGDSMYLLGDPSLVHEPFRDLLAACREKLEGTIDESVELVIEAPSLSLSIGEDSPYASSSTLIDIVEIYARLTQNDGVEEPSPLEVELKVEKRFFAQFSFLRDAMADGRGLTEITQHEHDGDQQEDENENHGQQDGEGYDNDGAGESYDDNYEAETAHQTNKELAANDAEYDERNGENAAEENIEQGYEDEFEEEYDYENEGGGEDAPEAENSHNAEQFFETAPLENTASEIVDPGDDAAETAPPIQTPKYVAKDDDAHRQDPETHVEGEDNAKDEVEIDFFLEDDELGVSHEVNTNEAGAVNHDAAADSNRIESQSKGDSDSDATLQATNAANKTDITAVFDDLDEIQLPEDVDVDGKDNVLTKSKEQERRDEPVADSLRPRQDKSKEFEAKNDLHLGSDVDFTTDSHIPPNGSKGKESNQKVDAAEGSHKREANEMVQEPNNVDAVPIATSQGQDNSLLRDELDDEFDIPPSAGLDKRNMYIDPEDQIDWSDDEIDLPAPSNPPTHSDIKIDDSTGAHISDGLKASSHKRSFEDFNTPVETATQSSSAAKRPRAS